MTTPCKERGWKEGDKFYVQYDKTMVNKGSIIQLVNDDGTEIPFFKLMEGEFSDIAKTAGFKERHHFAEWIYELEKIGDD